MRSLVFLAPMALIAAPAMAAAIDQQRPADAEQPASPPADAACAPGDAAGGIKDSGNPGEPAACVAGSPIGGIVVKGGTNPTWPPKGTKPANAATGGGVAPPVGASKSISEKGVSATKSR